MPDFIKFRLKTGDFFLPAAKPTGHRETFLLLLLFTVGETGRSRTALFMGFFSGSEYEILLATGVFDHEKNHGGVHFAHGGDQGAVGGPRVPVQSHETMQII